MAEGCALLADAEVAADSLKRLARAPSNFTCNELSYEQEVLEI
jgi:hypothetical protein